MDKETETPKGSGVQGLGFRVRGILGYYPNSTPGGELGSRGKEDIKRLELGQGHTSGSSGFRVVTATPEIRILKLIL